MSAAGVGSKSIEADDSYSFLGDNTRPSKPKALLHGRTCHPYLTYDIHRNCILVIWRPQKFTRSLIRQS